MHHVYQLKSGLNVEEVLERIVTDLPAPKGDENAKTKCLNI